MSSDISNKESGGEDGSGNKPFGRSNDSDASVSQSKTSVYEAFKLLQDNGLKVGDWQTLHGYNALHIAATAGKLDMVEALVQLGVDVNTKSGLGYTALFYSAVNGHAAILSFLLAHGASVEHDRYILHKTVQNAHDDVVELLIKAGADFAEADMAGRGPALLCCFPYLKGEEHQQRQARTLDIILQSGDDPHQMVDGMSLLHQAALNGIKECFEVLVDRGVPLDMLTTDAENETALHLACKYGRVNCVLELVRLGANVDAVEMHTNQTPLYDAIGSGNLACVSAMIELGASVTIKDRHGMTPLHLAALFGEMRAAYLLVEAGADVDVVTDDGVSPLMACLKPDAFTLVHKTDCRTICGSSSDREKVAIFLLEMGAEAGTDVMECATEGRMSHVVAKRMSQLTDKGSSKNVIAHTLMQHDDKGVVVKLVDRKTQKEASTLYKINTELMELLTKVSKEEEVSKKMTDLDDYGGAAPSPTAVPISPPPLSPSPVSPPGVISRLLHPEDSGFKENYIDADGTVTLEYDGSDFTEEGFAATVEFLTTGTLDNALVNRKRKRSSIESGGDGGGNGYDGGGLFKSDVAAKALQAAQFFCLENMTAEVKRLMQIFGFDYAET